MKQIINASFTYLNACLGSALLTLPHIFKVVGLYPFLICMTLSVSYSLFSFYVLNKISKFGVFPTCASIIKVMYGRFWAIITDISVVCCNTASLISYVNVASDFIRTSLCYFTKY